MLSLWFIDVYDRDRLEILVVLWQREIKNLGNRMNLNQVSCEKDFKSKSFLLTDWSEFTQRAIKLYAWNDLRYRIT